VALVPYQSLAGEVGSGGDGEETLVAALVNLLRPALLSLFVQVLTHSAQCTYPRLPLTCYSLFNHLFFFVQVLTHSAQCTYPRLPLTCYSLFNHFVFFGCRVARQCSTRARRSGDGAATRKAPFAF
jgi:hypothetical protein